MKVGDKVVNDIYGEAVICEIEGEGKEAEYTIRLKSSGMMVKPFSRNELKKLKVNNG